MSGDVTGELEVEKMEEEEDVEEDDQKECLNKFIFLHYIPESRYCAIRLPWLN